MERFTKWQAIERARHLCNFFEEMTDREVLVCADGSVENKVLKFMAKGGNASSFYVGGTTWTDLYTSLCAVEDGIAFLIENQG